MTPDDRFALRANAMFHDVYDRKGERFDPSSVWKLVAPVGADMAGDRTGRGWRRPVRAGRPRHWLPERGYFSVATIARIRLPFGLSIERDLPFESVTPLTVGSRRHAGSILAAELLLHRADQIESDLWPTALRRITQARQPL